LPQQSEEGKILY